MFYRTGLLPVALQNNTFILPSRWLPHMLLDQTDTWIMRETIQPRLLFRNLHVILDHHESQPSKHMGIANLLACNHLDRLDIEICIPESIANDAKAIMKWSVNEAIALRVVIRQLRERFRVAVKVLIGGPSATPEKGDITWILDRPSGELARFMAS